MVIGLISRVRAFYSTNLQVGDLLGETFYAVWMVVVSLGLLGGMGLEGWAVAYVLLVAFIVNTICGLIDGLTVMYTRIIERAESEKAIFDLQTKGDREARRRGADALSEGITSVLGPDEREKVLDMIASSATIGEDPAVKPYYPGKKDWRYMLGILSIDVLLVVPLVAPFVLLSEASEALYLSRLIATVIFAVLGAVYAKHLHRRRWLAALFLGTLCSSLFTLVFLVGW